LLDFGDMDAVFGKPPYGRRHSRDRSSRAASGPPESPEDRHGAGTPSAELTAFIERLERLLRDVERGCVLVPKLRRVLEALDERTAS